MCGSTKYTRALVEFSGLAKTKCIFIIGLEWGLNLGCGWELQRGLVVGFLSNALGSDEELFSDPKLRSWIGIIQLNYKLGLLG